MKTGGAKKWKLCLYVMLVVVACALASGCGKNKVARVWFITDVPLAETTELVEKVKHRLQTDSGGRSVVMETKVTLGDQGKLGDILSIANDGKVNLVVAVGVNVATNAQAMVKAIPVVYMAVSYPDAYGLTKDRSGAAPFVGVGQETDAESYCQELEKIQNIWGDVGVIIPKGHLGGEAEMDAFAAAYKKKFEMDVKAVVIDAKTCAQLMDVVGVYNLIASERVSLFYAIDDGNLSKYLGTLVRQCTRRNIPVIGGGQSVIAQGGILAIIPDQDALAEQCAVMMKKVLEGQECGHEKASRYETLWNTNALENLGLKLKE